MAKAFSSGWSSALSGGADTIVARATPAGRGALAVIRLSGPATVAVAKSICPEVNFASGRVARLVTLRDQAGAELERGVAVPFPAPKSYTGEDMLEVTVHGSPYIVERAVETFVAAGARRAQAGEFTRRAVANGKIDLIQAEAINDLIAAETAWQVRLAHEQLGGALSLRFAELRSALLALLSTFEAVLDFTENDVVVEPGELVDQREYCVRLLQELLATAEAGKRVRDGVRVVILGSPNAGKSTLFNTLCGSERAIVSPHPGTTRDVLEAELDFEGVRLILQDTAGLRPGGDSVEAEGHRRAVGAAASAAAVLLLWAADRVADEPPPDPPAGVAAVRLLSKCDLAGANTVRDGWMPISCLTGEGLEPFRAEFASVVLGQIADLGGETAIAARHRLGLEKALAEIGLIDCAAPELAAERIRWAVRAVEEMTGEVSSEEVLDEIFNAFCIGK